VIALIVILFRVGLALSRSSLHRVGRRVLLLAFLPAVIEMAVITLVAPSLLGLTRLASLVLGTVLAAVSPAIIVPVMLRFKEQGRAGVKGIPSMVMAVASVDDVFVIVVHTAVLGMYVGHHTGIAMHVVSVPISLLAGVFPFAGLVSAMAIGFIILERDEAMAHELSAKLAKVWVFAEIVLFSMVGAEVVVRLAWQAGLVGAVTIFVTFQWPVGSLALAGGLESPAVQLIDTGSRGRWFTSSHPNQDGPARCRDDDAADSTRWGPQLDSPGPIALAACAIAPRCSSDLTSARVDPVYPDGSPPR